MASIFTSYESSGSGCGLGMANGSPSQQGIPPRALNGGLYTGEPFAKDAPWANVPVVPDVTYMIHHNLRSAKPPPGALVHYPGTVRPGNNEPLYEGVQRVAGWNHHCATPETQMASRGCACKKCALMKYSYL